MTELRTILCELEEAIPAAPEDFETVRKVGAQRLFRWRVATAVGSMALAGVLVAAATAIPFRSAPETSDASDLAPRAPLSSWSGWREMATAPISVRGGAAYVATLDELLIWGGHRSGHANDRETGGAIYSPKTDIWREISPAPIEGGGSRSAVWTGQEMILWGGEIGTGSHARPDNGAAYDPDDDTWRRLPESPVWSLAGHRAVWTGTEMLVWGGVDNFAEGAAYEPSADRWRMLPTPPIPGRSSHVAVWTGKEMIVWGGEGEYAEPLNDGAAYDPASNSWRILPRAPLSPRSWAEGAWTGTEMIVWGGAAGRPGEDKTRLSDGAAYDPSSDSWRRIADAPISSSFMTYVVPVTGGVVVFGDADHPYAYDLATDTWSELPSHKTLPRHEMVVSNVDGHLIVWGGAMGRAVPPQVQGIRSTAE